jgi:hypothetical protein
MSEANRSDGYVQRIAAYFSDRLGARLIEVYKLGSLAHGGFSAVYSDIDVGLLLNCVDPPEEMAEAIATAKDLDPEFGKKLSIFWGNPEYTWGRLPVIDRLDLLDHSVPLLRGFKPRFRRPSRTEIHRALADTMERSYRSRLTELNAISTVAEHQRKPYIRTVLYPARFIYTWDNLAVDSNDRAVEYLHQIRPHGLELAPIDRALACRQGKCAADDVFALQVDLGAQLSAAEQYVSGR